MDACGTVCHPAGVQQSPSKWRIRASPLFPEPEHSPVNPDGLPKSFAPRWEKNGIGKQDFLVSGRIRSSNSRKISANAAVVLHDHLPPGKFGSG